MLSNHKFTSPSTANTTLPSTEKVAVKRRKKEEEDELYAICMNGTSSVCSELIYDDDEEAMATHYLQQENEADPFAHGDEIDTIEDRTGVDMESELMLNGNESPLIVESESERSDEEVYEEENESDSENVEQTSVCKEESHQECTPFISATKLKRKSVTVDVEELEKMVEEAVEKAVKKPRFLNALMCGVVSAVTTVVGMAILERDFL